MRLAIHGVDRPARAVHPRAALPGFADSRTEPHPAPRQPSGTRANAAKRALMVTSGAASEWASASRPAGAPSGTPAAPSEVRRSDGGRHFVRDRCGRAAPLRTLVQIAVAFGPDAQWSGGLSLPSFSTTFFRRSLAPSSSPLAWRRRAWLKRASSRKPGDVRVLELAVALQRAVVVALCPRDKGRCPPGSSLRLGVGLREIAREHRLRRASGRRRTCPGRR